jgi:ubiquinone/menaquinone biosynthesis C-methylase UbiE
MAELKTTFSDADAYERFMGRWSRAIGEKFLTWIAAPKNANWLDIGCGNGAFTGLILKHCAPAHVLGIDPAPAQIEAAKKNISAPQVEFRAGTAVYLPFRIDEFDVVVSALVIHFIPDRAKGFREMLRVVKPGGLVAGYTWEFDETRNGAPYQPMERGLATLGVDARRAEIMPEGMPDGMKAALQKTGFTGVETTVIEVSQTYRDFDDYWVAQTAGFARTGQAVAALSESDREKLREHMRKTLPTAKDGSITYSARATSFKARKAQ